MRHSDSSVSRGVYDAPWVNSPEQESVKDSFILAPILSTGIIVVITSLVVHHQQQLPFCCDDTPNPA
jgi:hypothetical protein